MSGITKIEWADKVWNPITGCTKVSEGCRNCYAERIAARFWKGRKFTDIQCHEERLEEPLHWKKPARIFVNSMSDLFHPDVPFEYITRIFDVMCSWRYPNKEAEREGDESLLEDPGHDYLILTKRPDRIKKWLDWVEQYWPGDTPMQVNLEATGTFGDHIWLGVSVSQDADLWMVEEMLKTPAAVRFVSVEPMLGPVELEPYLQYEPFMEEWRGLDWVICGCESGANARPMDLDWGRRLRDQCQQAGVPFFFKQAVIDGKFVKMPKLDGRVWAEFPGGTK